MKKSHCTRYHMQIWMNALLLAMLTRIGQILTRFSILLKNLTSTPDWTLHTACQNMTFEVWLLHTGQDYRVLAMLLLLMGLYWYCSLVVVTAVTGFVDRVKPVFKGHSDEWHHLIWGPFLWVVSYLSCVEKNLWWMDISHVATLTLGYWGALWRQVLLYFILPVSSFSLLFFC